MPKYRDALPQLGTQLFLTDSGLETSLVFQEGYDMPCFAAFNLIKQPDAWQFIKDYYEQHAATAVRAHCGFILEAHTWRANRDWAVRLGYDKAQLDAANKACITMMGEVRADYELAACPMVISGCIGPRGDGYTADQQMTVTEAATYHREQITSFSESAADMVSAMTLTYPEEAIGICLAAREQGMPVVISFTTETDGRLPNGITLKQAIQEVDAATNNTPAYYMINCAHPDHFRQALADNEDWVQRVRGVRANASRRSHAELDNAENLDSGNPVELGELYQALRQQFPQFTILGGCCGTDHRHVQEISHSCCSLKRVA